MDSAGARTSTGGQLFADRDHPGHYVALDWFTDYDSAMVNSAPAGDLRVRREGEGAEHRRGGRSTTSSPPWRSFIQGEPELRHAFETNEVAAHAFADDVVLDMIVPHGRVVTTGAGRHARA